MDKHIDLRIEDLKDNIYKAINESQLTLNIIKYVLSDIYAGVKIQNDDNLRELKINYQGRVAEQQRMQQLNQSNLVEIGDNASVDMTLIDGKTE